MRVAGTARAPAYAGPAPVLEASRDTPGRPRACRNTPSAVTRAGTCPPPLPGNEHIHCCRSAATSMSWRGPAATSMSPAAAPQQRACSPGRPRNGHSGPMSIPWRGRSACPPRRGGRTRPGQAGLGRTRPHTPDEGARPGGSGEASGLTYRDRPGSGLQYEQLGLVSIPAHPQFLIRHDSRAAVRAQLTKLQFVAAGHEAVPDRGAQIR
ncbi:hypothetical protein C8D78_1829 [Arthrobacter oryzae]|uniref:Uncharacterized protein n=1 Tax=Arthrobacter oryzae TaxID=409290 RepID=A0A495EV69_9MICC|nr:hypothetical protein C8D78_1829 [Arthrobacter oryzae]